MNSAVNMNLGGGSRVCPGGQYARKHILKDSEVYRWCKTKTKQNKTQQNTLEGQRRATHLSPNELGKYS